MKHSLLYILIISLTIFNSCQSKEEAKTLFNLYTESDRLLATSGEECIITNKRIEKITHDNGDRPADTLLYRQARVFSDSILSIQNDLEIYRDSIFHHYLHKDYNFNHFDTLALLKKIEPDTSRLRYIEHRLQKLIHQYDLSEKSSLFHHCKNEYQFLEIKHNVIKITIPEKSSSAGILLLCLKSLSIEINDIGRTGLKNIFNKMNTELSFALQPMIKVQSNIIEEGQDYKATLTFSSKVSTGRPISMRVNNQTISCNENNSGEVIIKAQADKFNSKGLAKKIWTGEIDFRYKGKDSTFIIKKEYYVKKKCHEK